MFKFLFAAFSIFSVTAMGAPAHAEDNMSYFEEASCEDCASKDSDATSIAYEAKCQVGEERA